MNFWWHFSNLADVVTMAVVAAMIMAGLIFGRAWRSAIIWCLLITTGMLLVVISKIAFLGWGIGICSLDFTGFSGHATRAMAIVPVFIYLALNRVSRPLQIVGVVVGVTFAIAIGVSRLVLHVHSISEVVAGWILGGGIALSFTWCSGKAQDFYLHKFALLIGIVVLSMLPAPGAGATQRFLVDVSLYLSGNSISFERQECASHARKWKA